MAIKVRGARGSLLSDWLCGYNCRVIFVLGLAGVICSAQRGVLTLLRMIAVLKVQNYTSLQKRCFNRIPTFLGQCLPYMNSILAKDSICPLELPLADTKRAAKTWLDETLRYISYSFRRFNCLLSPSCFVQKLINRKHQKALIDLPEHGAALIRVSETLAQKLLSRSH